MKPIGTEKQRQKHRREKGGEEKKEGQEKNQTEKGGKDNKETETHKR
jgi:hypothetical protein